MGWEKRPHGVGGTAEKAATSGGRNGGGGGGGQTDGTAETNLGTDIY